MLGALTTTHCSEPGKTFSQCRICLSTAGFAPLALFLTQTLKQPSMRTSQFFADFFGLKFVPASAYGFARDCESHLVWSSS